MSLPEHPDTIIIQNRFYRKGLKEIDVWNYYQRAKSPLLREVTGRDLLFFIMVDINKPIVRRRAKETVYIRLTNSNYDTVITGRSVSIHSAMKRYEDIGIIDIDAPDWRRAKVGALDVYETMMKAPFVGDVQIRYTGKTGFHIFCTFGRKLSMDVIRLLLMKHLRDSGLENNYTIAGRRTSGFTNLDLAPNKFRGNFICLHSLSVWGLRCMEVDHGDVLGFDPFRATIKVS